jgi:hypothetical protein
LSGSLQLLEIREGLAHRDELIGQHQITIWRSMTALVLRIMWT